LINGIIDHIIHGQKGEENMEIVDIVTLMKSIDADKTEDGVFDPTASLIDPSTLVATVKNNKKEEEKVFIYIERSLEITTTCS
jgi:hypothetical protein